MKKSDLEAFRLSPPHDLEDVYKVKVRILNKETKEIVEFEDYLYWNNDEDCPSTYIWEEGNYSCGCNRNRHFNREGKGLKDGEFQESDCSDERFLVELINPKNNKIIYSEFIK